MSYTVSIGKVMISQPMGGKTHEEILATKAKAVKDLSQYHHTLVDTLFTDEWTKNEASSGEYTKSPLWFLAKSLEAMSRCNTVYFCKGWENARGCKIEHEAAVEYGLHIMYEE